MPPTIDDYLARLANLAVGPTTLRNQGASGVAETARIFLSELSPACFTKVDETAFIQELDQQTETLKQKLPNGARNWGTARKAINLFLGEAYYHRFICKAFALDGVERFLEVPLDSQVAHYLMQQAKEAGVFLPRWLSIKSLSPNDSKLYQDFAARLASTMGDGWVRIHIDVIAWKRL